MWKNEFFSPAPQNRGVLVNKGKGNIYSQRNATMPLCNETGQHVVVCASSALIRIKAWQKMLYLSLLPKNPRVPYP